MEKGDRSFNSTASGSGDGLCHDDDLRVTGEISASEEGIPLRLAAVINGEIIPRLFVLNNENVENAGQTSHSHVRLEDLVPHYAQLVLEGEGDRAFTFIAQLHADGFQLDKIMVDLLAPTARQLGVWWEEDKIDFVDVTIGTSRLKQVLHRYRPSSAGRLYESSSSPRILLLPTPHETHTFGLLVIGEMFRQRGWEVGGGHALEDHEVSELLSEQHWDIVGFSLANVRLMDTLGAVIRSTRRQSKNKSVKILAGGHAFHDSGGAGEQLGADLIVSDPTQAVTLGEALLPNALNGGLDRN